MKTIEQIVERLTATEQTVAIAESCTAAWSQLPLYPWRGCLSVLKKAT